jgi:hypothetical protein
MQITTSGLDIAKKVFQVHGIDATEKVVVRKQLRRSQVLAFFKALLPCLIGMEACATAHYWARELTIEQTRHLNGLLGPTIGKGPIEFQCVFSTLSHFFAAVSKSWSGSPGKGRPGGQWDIIAVAA